MQYTKIQFILKLTSSGLRLRIVSASSRRCFSLSCSLRWACAIVKGAVADTAIDSRNFSVSSSNFFKSVNRKHLKFKFQSIDIQVIYYEAMVYFTFFMLSLQLLFLFEHFVCRFPSTNKKQFPDFFLLLRHHLLTERISAAFSLEKVKTQIRSVSKTKHISLVQSLSHSVIQVSRKYKNLSICFQS